jgi:hypothetical protein
MITKIFNANVSFISEDGLAQRRQNEGWWVEWTRSIDFAISSKRQITGKVATMMPKQSSFALLLSLRSML